MIYRFDCFLNDSCKQLYPGAAINLVPHLSAILELKAGDQLLLTMKEPIIEQPTAEVKINNSDSDSDYERDCFE
jgi:hypothetical protein